MSFVAPPDARWLATGLGHWRLFVAVGRLIGAVHFTSLRWNTRLPGCARVPFLLAALAGLLPARHLALRATNP